MLGPSAISILGNRAKSRPFVPGSPVPAMAAWHARAEMRWLAGPCGGVVLLIRETSLIRWSLLGSRGTAAHHFTGSLDPARESCQLSADIRWFAGPC